MQSGLSLPGSPYIPRRGLSDAANFHSIDISKPFYQTEAQDLNSSKIEFLENQTQTEQDSFKAWKIISLVINTLTIAFSIYMIVVWFSWLNNISRADIQCTNLKSQLIWVIVVYVIGIFCQVLGIISGFLKSIVGFLVYELLLIGMVVVRIVLDIPTINSATSSLQGCASTLSSIPLNDYIYATIIYCILGMVLFSCNINIIRILKRVKKTQKIQTEFVKNEKFGASHV